MTRISLHLAPISHSLIARLENWGNVYRDRPRIDISATGRFCDRLARNKLGENYDSARQPRADNDVVDAAILETVWRSLPTISKLALFARYMRRIAPGLTRRLLRSKGVNIKEQEYCRIEIKAHEEMQIALANKELQLYNPHNNLRTAKAARVHQRDSLSPEIAMIGF